MPSKIRLQRINDRIRTELSTMLVMEVADPRLGGVTVTDVRVDRELAYADVYVSAVEGHERSKEILEGLRSAAGFLRKALADRVDLRVFPRLRFHWDPTPERADHIERVLAELRAEEQNRPPAPENTLDADAGAEADAVDAEDLDEEDFDDEELDEEFDDEELDDEEGEGRDDDK